MPIVPKSRPGMLEFYESHIGPWQEDPGSIGLDAAATDAQAARIAEARAAFDAHLAATSAARAATQRYHDAVAAMHADPGAGSDMIETIKTFAQTTDDPGVYARAEIPPPKAPSTAPPPGTPGRFRVALRQNGAVELAWKCDNPPGTSGTVYEVYRATDDGPMTHLATVGTKAFTDTTIPAGTAQVVYQLTALRSTRRGEPAQFNVHFGRAEGKGGRGGRGGGGGRGGQEDRSGLEIAA